MRNRIKECRERLGLSQEQLSEKSGISRTTIAGFENGNIDCTTNITMQKLSEALNRSVKYIFYL